MRGLMPVLYYVYAAILLGGGVMGSMKSGKPSSLIGSAVFAAVAVVAGVLSARPANTATGLIVGLINGLAVTAFFIYRYTATGKPFPAFPSIALSLIVAALSVYAIMSRTRSAF